MDILRCDPPAVVFQECPGEVALCFTFYGCPLRCEGCHSQQLWRGDGGSELFLAAFENDLQRYSGLITAVVFFGGEWQPLALQQLLKVARRHGLKTCLYSGLNQISRHLRHYLDYAKLGPWRADRGGLDNPYSNQRYYRLQGGELAEDLSQLFHRNQQNNDTAIPLINTLTEVPHAAT